MITSEYQSALLALRENYQWGYSGGKYAGETIVNLLNEFPEVKTILDYGCGGATLKEYVEEKGITDREWTLYDPGVEELKEPPKGKFDLVITTDVLEHVEEEHIDSVIDDLNDLTGKYLFNEVACYLARRNFQSGPYEGEDLHISLKAPDDWMLRLARPDMGVITSTACVHYGWKVRYLSIQERI